MCSRIHIDAHIHIYVHHKVMQTRSITTSIKINPQKQKNNCRPLPTSRNHQIYRLVAKVHHTHVRKHIFIYVSIEMSTANRPANLTFCTSQFEFQTFFCYKILYYRPNQQPIKFEFKKVTQLALQSSVLAVAYQHARTGGWRKRMHYP